MARLLTALVLLVVAAGAAQAEFKKPIYTEIVATGPFYKAEDYHQDFYLKNPTKYKFYRWSCGRDQRLQQLWGAHTEKGEG